MPRIIRNYSRGIILQNPAFPQIMKSAALRERITHNPARDPKKHGIIPSITEDTTTTALQSTLLSKQLTVRIKQIVKNITTSFICLVAIIVVIIADTNIFTTNNFSDTLFVCHAIIANLRLKILQISKNPLFLYRL